MARTCWWYYLSKFTEFFDTLFFILRKKNEHVSTLHVIHHGCMPFSVWMGMKYAPGGHSTFFALLNTFVHVVMYFYYMISAMGPKYQKYIWWKKYLTTFQMVQFVAIFTHQFQLLFHECDYPRGFMIYIGLHGVMFLLLFSDFYKAKYTKGIQVKGHLERNGTNYKNCPINGEIYTNGHSNKGACMNFVMPDGMIILHSGLRLMKKIYIFNKFITGTNERSNDPLTQIEQLRIIYPRVKDWPMMSSPAPTLALCILYAYFSKSLGPKLMRNRKAFDLRKLLIYYNLCQTLFSAWMFYEYLMSGWWGHYNFTCQPVDYSNNPLALRPVVDDENDDSPDLDDYKTRSNGIYKNGFTNGHILSTNEAILNSDTNTSSLHQRKVK
uniref:Elongation of very long chain fatty acids protein n=1 Tax=Glossina austeni TaxID=7395 RepID=A0A1A9VN85_GLOAU